MKKTALIMAGGRGERFWPRSRRSMPKQFLSLTGDGKTMLQQTVDRILPLVDISDIYIATNESYKKLIKDQLPNIPYENIICEPVGKNTAPCIALGAVHIKKKYGDATMIVLPSDHLIKYNAMFLDTLKKACEVAESGENLVTLGIMPHSPETGYGYIKFRSDSIYKIAMEVECFVEKPNLETAKEYLASEQYLWNSGMFIWKVSTILNNIEEYLPEIYNGICKIGDAIGTDEQEKVLKDVFTCLPSQSIDYGVMEKAKNIYILTGTFGWDDVGSWLAVDRIRTSDAFGNVVTGNVVSVNTKNSIIEGGEKLIATVGLNDVIVVDTKDAVLICKKDSAGDIKKVIENLRFNGQEKYL